MWHPTTRRSRVTRAVPEPPTLHKFPIQAMVFQRISDLLARYSSSTTLRKIVSNISWLFVDKALRMGVGLIVGVWVARYLGPGRFGTLNYAIAFASLFGTLAVPGIDSILVRELVATPERRDALLGSAFFLKLTFSLITFPIIVGAISCVRHGDTELFRLVCLCSFGFIVQSTNVIACFFQSKVLSKYTVYATNLAFIAAALLRVAFILQRRPLIAFGYSALIELVLGAIFLSLVYRHQGLTVMRWVFNRNVAKQLLRDGWPLIISAMAISFYVRIDQVMIGQMLNNRQVGIYSAALRVSEIWYFIPMSVVGTLLPAIVESRQHGERVYNRRIGSLYSLMAWSGIAVAMVFTFASHWVIHILYGEAFAGADSILRIHIWTGVPVALGVACATVLAAENAQIISLYATVIGAVVNVLLNWFLIPLQGARGAAMATLASQWAALLATVLLTRSRRMGYTMLRSFIFR